jgi:replicative DNA helicase
MIGEKQLPHDIDAEEAVIGSLLLDGQSIFHVAGFLTRDDFYHEGNRDIYGACYAIYQRQNEAINQIAVAQELAQQGKLEACGGAANLSHLMAICPTPMDIEHYARIVYRLSVMRQLVNAGNSISAVGYQSGPDVEDSLGRAESILFKLRRGQGSHDLTHIRNVLDKYLEDTLVAPEKEQRLACVPTGYAGLDELLGGGFQRSELVIVGGRPSMGKTSLALNIARNAAVEHHACVALFSLEMAKEALVMRLLSSESRVNSRNFAPGKHTDSDESHIMEATGLLSEAPIYIDDTPMLRMGEMRSKCLRFSFENTLDMIIIDYLQLMQGDKSTDNRVQEVSEISRALKGLARELNVPVVAVSQLNRAPQGRASHEPQLADLRESGSIEQDADVVLLIYREEYYFPDEQEWKITQQQQQREERDYPRGQADIIVAKNRNGPTDRIKLHFQHNLAKFENINAGEPSLL